jgi:hypothetical protein
MKLCATCCARKDAIRECRNAGHRFKEFAAPLTPRGSTLHSNRCYCREVPFGRTLCPAGLLERLEVLEHLNLSSSMEFGDSHNVDDQPCDVVQDKVF